MIENMGMATNSMVIFTRAALMLAEADTIQKAKELKGLALTAGEWAKRKGMGEAAIQHCRSYALEAERKMGEMLSAGQADGRVAKKGQPKRNVPGGDISPVRLLELGLTRIQDNGRFESEAVFVPADVVFGAISECAKTKIIHG